MPDRKLPKVVDHMDTIVHTVFPDTDIFDVIGLLLDHRVTGAPVVDRTKKLLGMVTEKDCLKLITIGADHQEPSGTAGDFMTTELKTIRADMDVYFAAGIFLGNAFRRLPVVDTENRLVGAITRFDILRVIRSELRR